MDNITSVVALISEVIGLIILLVTYYKKNKKLMDKIADRMHIDKVDVYREAIKSIGGVSETVCVQDKAVDRLRQGWEQNGIGWQTDTMPSKLKGCTNVILYYGSSTYDTQQMSLLIDHIVQDAKALGIETMTPAELEALKIA